jgi:hypothetical protein
MHIRLGRDVRRGKRWSKIDRSWTLCERFCGNQATEASAFELFVSSRRVGLRNERNLRYVTLNFMYKFQNLMANKGRSHKNLEESSVYPTFFFYNYSIQNHGEATTVGYQQY